MLLEMMFYLITISLNILPVTPVLFSPPSSAFASAMSGLSEQAYHLHADRTNKLLCVLIC